MLGARWLIAAFTVVIAIALLQMCRLRRILTHFGVVLAQQPLPSHRSSPLTSIIVRIIGQLTSNRACFRTFRKCRRLWMKPRLLWRQSNMDKIQIINPVDASPEVTTKDLVDFIDQLGPKDVKEIIHELEE